MTFIDKDVQTFVTTTELDKLIDDLKVNSKIFIVDSNGVREEKYEI